MFLKLIKKFKLIFETGIFFYKLCLIYNKEFKIDFQNRKKNYFSHFQAFDQKLLLQNVSYSKQALENRQK